MIITIEGNIGAGKTSFAYSLYMLMKNEKRPVLYITEPVDSWKDVGGDNLLEMLYNDRERWAFTFQANALMQMTELDRRALEYSDLGFTVIRERSSYSCRNIFIPLLVSTSMSAAERHVLKELCKAISSPLLTVREEEEEKEEEEEEKANRTSSNVTIYLRTDPDTCLKRIKKRGRPEEIGGKVNMNYLQKLHELHENVFSESFNGMDRLVIADGNFFDETDATSIKIFGEHDQVVNAIVSAIVDGQHTAQEENGTGLPLFEQTSF
jgi:deoxyadenosine/deoxycytidine kinase